MFGNICEIIYIYTHTQKDEVMLKMLTVTEFGASFVSFFTFSTFSQSFLKVSSSRIIFITRKIVNKFHLKTHIF